MSNLEKLLQKHKINRIVKECRICPADESEFEITRDVAYNLIGPDNWNQFGFREWEDCGHELRFKFVADVDYDWGDGGYLNCQVVAEYVRLKTESELLEEVSKAEKKAETAKKKIEAAKKARETRRKKEEARELAKIEKLAAKYGKKLV